MPNTILTYTSSGIVGPNPSTLASMTAIPIDVTLPKLWGLLPITDTPAFAAPILSRVIVCQMTPTIADAAGTAVLAGGGGQSVASITMTNQGGLYYAPPVITFTGGNPVTPAQAFASCQVRGCNVLLPGAGYTGATIVTFVGPLAPGGVPATGTVTVMAGAVTAIVMTNTGGPYRDPPLAVISDTGGGVGAEVVAGLSVSSFTVTYGGAGYQGVPTVVCTPLFKQMVPDSAGNPKQQATLQEWMDVKFGDVLKMPFVSAVVAT